MKKAITFLITLALITGVSLPLIAAPAEINIGEWINDAGNWGAQDDSMMGRAVISEGVLILPSGVMEYEDILAIGYTGKKVRDFTASFKFNMQKTEEFYDWHAFFIFRAQNAMRPWETTDEYYFVWITDVFVQLGRAIPGIGNIWYTEQNFLDNNIANNDADFLVTCVDEGDEVRITVSVDGKEYINAVDDGTNLSGVDAAPIQNEGIIGFVNNPSIGGDITISAGSLFLGVVAESEETPDEYREDIDATPAPDDAGSEPDASSSETVDEETIAATEGGDSSEATAPALNPATGVNNIFLLTIITFFVSVVGVFLIYKKARN